MPEVIPACAAILRRTLPPRAFQFVRVPVWYIAFYLPRLVVSWFVTRTPEVQEFGDHSASEFVRQLRSVNALTPTKMCRVMTKHGSDKGNWRLHNYTVVYSLLLNGLRDKPLRIF